MPRISWRQQYCANQPYQSVEEYFRHSVTIPFLDHLISELSLRFNEHTKKAALVQHLLPVWICSSSSMQDIEQPVAFYGDDLPNRSIVDEDYECWKAKWILIPSQDRSQTLSDSLKHCCSINLPNIFTLLKLFATLPLSSCSYKRSASAIRWLNNYQKCSQLEEKLNALALIIGNYDYNIDVNRVCQIFMNKQPWRMECESFLFNIWNSYWYL